MGINVDIDNALTAKTQLLAAALGLPVGYPNNRIVPPETGFYLNVEHFKNTVVNNGWGDTDEEYPGIWQISVIGPADVGSIPSADIGEQVAAFFTKGTTMRSGIAKVTIEQKPSILTPIQDGHKLELPVSIPYRCFG